MQKVIAIFGAGSGLASSVARQYGAKGYAVALVARNASKLQKLAEHISTAEVETAIFTADLSDAQATASVVERIRAHFGRIDAIYYAPNPQDVFTPATQLTPAILQPLINLYFYGLVNVIQAVLPEFRARGEGRILSAFGGSAQLGFPLMSGVGPAMAAARNYLQSLQQELVSENIAVGVVTITAIVKNSAFHQSLQVQGHTGNAPDAPAFPQADPDLLAHWLDEALHDPLRLEAVYPPV